MRNKKIRSLKFIDNDLYLEDIPEEEEIVYSKSEELRTAQSHGNIEKLIELCNRSPTSSDPVCLLASAYIKLGKVSEAEGILLDSIEIVKQRSNIATRLGKFYQFDQPDFLKCLFWYLRSAIAQREKPYDWGTYIYLYAILSALNEYWIGKLDKHVKNCKTIADDLFGPGGVKLDYWVIQQVKDMYLNIPDVDISGDLLRALKSLKI